MAKNLYEIFDEFERANSREDRLYILRHNNSYALECVLRGAFHPNIQYDVESVPFFKPSDSPIGMGYSSIALELDRIYILEKNNPRVAQGLTKKRKEQILIQMLESLESREADILVGMIMKRLPVKDLTYKLVQEAFPGLLPNLE